MDCLRITFLQRKCICASTRSVLVKCQVKLFVLLNLSNYIVNSVERAEQADAAASAPTVSPLFVFFAAYEDDMDDASERLIACVYAIA